MKKRLNTFLLSLVLAVALGGNAWGAGFWGLGVTRTQLGSNSSGWGAGMIGVYDWIDTKLDEWFKGQYVVKQNANNQGAVGTVGTLAYIVNQAGGSDITVKFTGDYDFQLTSNYSVPGTVKLKVENGATINRAGGVTLTLASVGQVQSAPGAEIFTGPGLTVFTSAEGKRYTSMWGNDSTSLAEAEASCTTGGIIVVDGDFTISTGVVFDVDETVIEKSGDPVITYSGSGTAIKIDAKRITWPKIKIVKSSQEWDDGTDTTSIGIEMHEAEHCRIHPYLDGFCYGLKLSNTTGGTVFNTIFLDLIYDARYGIYFEDNDPGWSNSNTFIGGHITCRTSTDTTIAANMITRYALYLEDDTNNNIFYNVALESGVFSQYTQAIYCAGNQNDFMNPRLEFSGFDGSATIITFPATGIYNKLIGGRWVGGNSYTVSQAVSDSGTGNIVISGLQAHFSDDVEITANSGKFWGNPDTWPYKGDANLDVKNTGSGNYPVFIGRNAGSTQCTVITGEGQTLTGLPETARDTEATSAYQAMEQLKAYGLGDTSWPGAEWKRTTAHRKNSTASPATMWYVTVADGEIVQVIVELVGRKTDNSKVVQRTMKAIYTASGGASSLLDYDAGAATELNYNSFDTADITLDAAGALGRLQVGGNEAADYYFSAMISWQVLKSDS